MDPFNITLIALDFVWMCYDRVSRDLATLTWNEYFVPLCFPQIVKIPFVCRFTCVSRLSISHFGVQTC